MADVIVTWDLSGATGANSPVYTEPKKAVNANSATWNTNLTSAVHGQGNAADLLDGIQAIASELARQLRAPANANVTLRVFSATLMNP